MAARTSLQLPVDRQITTPFELFTWASNPNNLPSIEVEFSTIHDYNVASDNLASCFAKTKSITSTHKLHSVIQGTDDSLIVRDYSNSPEFRTCKILF